MTTPGAPSNVIPFPGSVSSAGTQPPSGSGGPPPATDPHLWSKQQVWAIRYAKRFNDDQKLRVLHNFICGVENRKTSRGAFLRTPDHRAFLFEGHQHKLYRIDADDPEFCAYLWRVYGFNTADVQTKHLITSLKNGTIAQGLLREVRRFTYWDRATKTLYISCYNGTCYEIDGDEVHVRPNGYGPAVFLDDDGGVDCPEPVVGNHRFLFKHLIDDLQYAPMTGGGMSPEAQKACLGIWLFALAFPDLMPTKPLLLVEGARGSGKCLQRGTRVMMHDGSVKPVEEILDGDLLMGPDSKPRRVAGTTRGHGELYQVTPSKGEPWVCNDAHILTVVCNGRTTKKRKATGLREWKHRGEIIDIPLLECKPYGKSTIVPGKGYANLLRVAVDFPTREIPYDPWLVGLWLGNGTAGEAHITQVDKVVHERCRKLGPKYGAAVVIVDDTPNNTKLIKFTYNTEELMSGGTFAPNPMRQYFRNLTIDGEKRIPLNYLRNDRSTRLELLAGLLDSDGHYETGGVYEISTKYQGLCSDIVYLARSVGLAAYSRIKISRIKSTGFEAPYHRIIISGHLDQIPCCVPRKKARPRKQIKNVLHTGFTLKPIGKGDYYGFTLDGDGRFLLGDFTVTHNTMALQRIALALHGKYMPIATPKKEDPDFGVKILRSPISILDDINEPVDWLRDTLCTYCTGGGWTRRTLFTDDAEHVIKPDSFLGVTTNNAVTFRQGQVADRCLIIRLERREEQLGYVAADRLFEAIRYDRNEIFGEWLYWLNEIVRELRRGSVPITSKTRMADFAHLAHVIGRVLSQPEHGLPGNWSAENIDEMLEEQQAERNALAVEGDPLADVLYKWLDKSSNQGREIRVADLFIELSNIARQANISFYRNYQTLTKRLKDASSAMTAQFDISHRSVGQTAFYTFRYAST